MNSNEQLDIEELIEGFRQYMGSQAQEIAILKATIKKLSAKIKDLESNSDKVE
jgi:cell division protein FtsB